jgi:NADP-dependent 3-hydroxy acid dehydrogenase YdfG
MNIKDKVAVVTGASKGIGRATALALAEAGAHVAVSARTSDKLDSLAHDIKQKGRNVFPFTGDMSAEDDIKTFIKQTAEHFGQIDILVNNAGMGHFLHIADMSTELWDEMFNLNVRGLFIATREALPYLRKAGQSAVVNVASLAGKNSFAGGGGYAASKHAVMAFSRCLMLEERKNGLRVLAICPGSVETRFFDHLEQDKQLMASPNLENALKPEDIASSITHMLQLPQHAMISEIDIRPSNP